MENKGDNGAHEKTARIAKKKGFNPLRSITAHFVKYIGEGALFWLAPVITLLILKFLFNKIDNLFPSITELIVGRDITGANFGIIVVCLYFSGLFIANTLGRLLGNWVKESLMPRIPLYKEIYIPAKKVVDILAGKTEVGTQVVVFEPARLAFYKAGVVMANFLMCGIPPVPYFSIYEATSPTPNSGINHFAPQELVYRAFVEVESNGEDGTKDTEVYPLTATKRELHKYHDEIIQAWLSRSYMSFIVTGGSACPGRIFAIDNNGNIVKDPVHHTE